jgi:hypothetical protein
MSVLNKTGLYTKRLSQLVEVHRHRMTLLQKVLAGQLTERASLDELLDFLDQDSQQIAAQRKNWHSQWQQWLHQGGALWQSRGYNDRHQQLSALEKLLEEHRSEITSQRDELQKKITQHTHLIMKHQKKMDAFFQVTKVAQQGAQKTAERRNTGSTDELALTRWFFKQQNPSGLEARHAS